MLDYCLSYLNFAKIFAFLDIYFVFDLIEDGCPHHIVCNVSHFSGNCHLDMEDACLFLAGLNSKEEHPVLFLILEGVHYGFI